jgi:hypothetical protein
MDTKVAALEEDMVSVKEDVAGVRTTLAAMEKNQAILIRLMEKSIGKSIMTGDESVGDQEGSVKKDDVGSAKKPGNSGTFSLNGDALLEFRHSAKKVELPMFNGDDPVGWLSRAEVYFRVQNTTPEIKVNLAQLCMEGPTIHFFNSLLDEEEVPTWERVKTALLERYGGQGDGDVYEQLAGLQQTGTIEDYIADFEYLTAQIPRLPDKQFQGYFIHG